MSTENQITVIGNLTRDPELRYTTGGVAVASLSVAQTPRRRVNGEWEDGDTNFFNVSVWREMGENVAASLQKGHRVWVTGRMSMRNWEDKDGNKRTSYDVEADEIGPSLKWGQTQFEKVSRSSGGNGGGGGGGRQAPEPQYHDEEPF